MICKLFSCINNATWFLKNITAGMRQSSWHPHVSHFRYSGLGTWMRASQKVRSVLLSPLCSCHFRISYTWNDKKKVIFWVIKHFQRTRKFRHKKSDISNKSQTMSAIPFLLWRCDPTSTVASSFLRFLDRTQWRTTVGRTPLVEWSAPSRNHYLTKHSTHKRQTSMPPTDFETTTSACHRP